MVICNNNRVHLTIVIPSLHTSGGSNTGIGKKTAISLAKRGARVILACRSQIRGEVAVAEVKEVNKTWPSFVLNIAMTGVARLGQICFRVARLGQMCSRVARLGGKSGPIWQHWQ